MKNYINILFLLLIVLPICYSCEDFFEVKSEEVLLEKDYLGDNKFDARSALFGILSQMQDLSKEYIVLNELRADLMDVTDAAIDELRQISEHNVNTENSYANPVKFFSIINNCNIALHGIDTSSVYSKEELLKIYVSILRVRTWTYLQIAINYGSVPYITKPISSAANLSANYPLLTFNQAIDSLINSLLIYSEVDNIDIYANSLGFSIYNLIPDKDILLGDLYLWANNYTEAATLYKQFLDRNVSGGGHKYNLTARFNVTFTLSSGIYRISNTNWKDIFQDAIQNDELIMYIPYTKQYRQPNDSYDELITGYQVKPSAEIIKNWTHQYRIFNNIIFDSIDTRAELSYNGTSALPVISKYKHDYMILNRAANVYLKYAEAINRAGYPLHALYVLNSGVKDMPETPGTPRFTGNMESYLNFEQSKYYTVSSTGVATGGNLGIRGRVGMAPLLVENSINLYDSIQNLELLILNESALETAFEGNRWSNLIRIAQRNNNPAILADAVSNKFSQAGSPLATSIRSKLLDKENWYLNLEVESNFVPVIK